MNARKIIAGIFLLLIPVLLIGCSASKTKSSAKSAVQPKSYEQNMLSIAERLDDAVAGLPQRDLNLSSLTNGVALKKNELEQRIKHADSLLSEIAKVKAPHGDLLKTHRKLVKDLTYIKKGLEVVLRGSKKGNNDLIEQGSIMISTNISDIFDIKKYLTNFSKLNKKPSDVNLSKK
jgi:hypothetical protein